MLQAFQRATVNNRTCPGTFSGEHQKFHSISLNLTKSCFKSIVPKFVVEERHVRLAPRSQVPCRGKRRKQDEKRGEPRRKVVSRLRFVLLCCCMCCEFLTTDDKGTKHKGHADRSVGGKMPHFLDRPNTGLCTPRRHAGWFPGCIGGLVRAGCAWKLPLSLLSRPKRHFISGGIPADPG